MSKWIDAEEVVHVSIYNEETEDYKVEACTIEEALDKYTDEGCPNAADVAPVRHGTWTITVRTNVYGGREIICSECGEGFMVSPKTLEFLSDTERYCCRCGAKMDR